MGRDRGSATVFLVSVLGLTMAMVLLAGAVVRILAARGVASTAADLASLAAASAQDCAAAQRVASQNQAVLQACSVQGADYLVTVSVDVSGLPGGVGPVTAMARAGPP